MPRKKAEPELEEIQGETHDSEALTAEATIEPTPEEETTSEIPSLTESEALPETAFSAPENEPVRARKKSFYETDINELDRYLSPEEAQEWNSIYASYRSRSILTGIVIGVDENTLEMRNPETGEIETKRISSLIVVNYRVKVLIPETELWVVDEERPVFVARGMVGSTIEFIILEIDREGECAIASRRMAQMSRRYFFGRSEHKEGERTSCRVVSVGPKRCLVECNGFDISLIPRELSYSAIPDLREKYRPGMELNCIIKQYSKDPAELIISVKEAMPNPFEGADKRHPVGSRRQAVISGKYRGGVFCTMPDGTVCHCLYASRHSDENFRIGDSVIIAIREFNYAKQQMFGRIIGKW